MYTVYIIYSKKLDKFYIGSSADLKERIRRHNSNNSKGFTSTGKPWLLFYSEDFEFKKEALIREKQLKNWKSREKIQKLAQHGSEHPDCKSGGS